MHETVWIDRYISPLVTALGADGLRDDVALLSASGPMIVTMDTIVEGVHFLPNDPLDTVGQKLVRVNASDILAKGADPAEAMLSIAWPHQKLESEFAALISGLASDLEEFDIALIGGDLVATDGPLTLTMTLTGRCINAGPVRRSGGRAGETLWVNGEIGWGGLGLRAAQNGGPEQFAQRFRVPRISSLFAAQTVAELATASIDVSDGLLIDASRLAAASGCGVEIDLGVVPLADPAQNTAEILSQCTAGDDYRILLSAVMDTAIPGFTAIGKLTAEPGLRLIHGGQAVNPPSILGFEH